MKRQPFTPRRGWQRRQEALGFHFHTLSVQGHPDPTYWDESVCYRFSSAQIETLERASADLFRLCLETVEHVLEHNLFSRLGIPERFGELCRRSWERDDPTLYGRFDLCWNGEGQPVMLEFNADTPTALLEASVAQWVWLEDALKAGTLPPDADQFNVLHEALLEQLRWMRQERGMQQLGLASVHSSLEDACTVEYLRDLALQAGMQAQHLDMAQIGWDSARRRFVDARNEPLEHVFKLYPWEWMLEDPFAEFLPLERCTWLEPPWKLILSSKGILALLWERYPGHPNLLPSFLVPEPLGRTYIQKPLFSREGANVRLVGGPEALETGGEYGQEGFVYQAYAPLPNFGSALEPAYPVIGAWIVGDLPAGIGLREDRSRITGNGSRFVPHWCGEGEG